MSPALTTPPSEDCLCASCMAKLDSGALKCSKCQKFVHVSCSELPKYYLVRLATSGAMYCCVRCCKTEAGEERYEEERQSINELFEREKLLIVPSTNDGHETSSGDVTSFRQLISNQEVNIVTETNNDATNQAIGVSTDSSASKKGICRYYLQNSCKHGPRGADCQYEHPKICFKFTSNGNRRGGCKKTDCQFYHPKLCRKAMESRRCDNKYCKFYHVKGTKFGSEEETSPQIQNSWRLPRNQQISENENYTVLSRKHNEMPSNSRNMNQDSVNYQPSRQNNPYNSNDQFEPVRQQDFLEMKNQVQQLFNQITELMKLNPRTNLQNREERCCPAGRQH